MESETASRNHPQSYCRRRGGVLRLFESVGVRLKYVEHLTEAFTKNKAPGQAVEEAGLQQIEQHYHAPAAAG